MYPKVTVKSVDFKTNSKIQKRVKFFPFTKTVVFEAYSSTLKINFDKPEVKVVILTAKSKPKTFRSKQIERKMI